MFNKCDIHTEDELKEIIDDILTRLDRKDQKYYVISAAAGINVKPLCSDVMNELEAIRMNEEAQTDEDKAQANNENFVWDKPEPPQPKFDDDFFDDEFDDFDEESFEDDDLPEEDDSFEDAGNSDKESSENENQKSKE